MTNGLRALVRLLNPANGSISEVPYRQYLEPQVLSRTECGEDAEPELAKGYYCTRHIGAKP